MFEWLKSNIVTAGLASVIGLGVVAGAYYYVVVVPTPLPPATTSAPQVPAPPSVAIPAIFPPRFMVDINGQDFFRCDLTVNQNASCTSSNSLALAGARVDIRRHPGDMTRVIINAFGIRREGVTWDELAKGTRVGNTTIRTFGQY
jgi:hypothetical protein